MKITAAMMIMAFLNIIIFLAMIVAGIYLVYLMIKALRKYLKAEPIREKKAESAKSLGEVLKNHRTECKMTQEFVAESLGVSRQAVSKWESGKSAPSTTNLLALAELFGLASEKAKEKETCQRNLFP